MQPARVGAWTVAVSRLQPAEGSRDGDGGGNSRAFRACRRALVCARPGGHRGPARSCRCSGLSADETADRLRRDGPNALPVEQPPSAIRRFLAEYTSYMQLILVGAVIVSLVIQQWSTAIVLIVITLSNALVGLRQAGKAESAMNALQSMIKATARVRRDGVEAEIPADGRIVASSALQIDESALTGESVRRRRTPGRCVVATSGLVGSRTWRSCTPRSRTGAGW